MKKAVMFWRNIKIGWKFSFSVMMCILLFAISMMVTFAQLSRVDEHISEMDKLSTSASTITEMGSIFRSMDIAIADYIINPTDENKENYLDKRKKLLDAGDKSKKEFNDPEETALYLKMIQNDKMLNDLFYITVMPAVEQNNAQTLSQARERANVLRDETIAALYELRDLKNKERTDAAEDSRSSMEQIAFTLLGALVVSIVLSGAITFVVQRMIIRHFNRVIRFSHEISAGNLAAPDLEYGGRDEIGQLTASQNELKTKMNNMVRQIKKASEELQVRSGQLNRASVEVNEGSSHVSATMQELAAGSSAQSHASSDIASQMDDFSRQLEKANEEGAFMRKSSHEVMHLVSQGSVQMNSSSARMNDIMGVMNTSAAEVMNLDDKTKEIAALVTVIEQIAEQTNLLSLNAAIEAARVGEHGKGFAVVADEVRKLAVGVSASVSDITRIVEDFKNVSKNVAATLNSGQLRVKDSASSIKQTGESFEMITKSIRKLDEKIANVDDYMKTIASGMVLVNRAAEEVAAVSEESAAGIEEVSASVHQSSENIREVAASSDRLKALSDELSQLVGEFQV
ncbi:methyl-accepting chemotaxis protein [Metabacillus sp. SLBN-84]